MKHTFVLLCVLLLAACQTAGDYPLTARRAAAQRAALMNFNRGGEAAIYTDALGDEDPSVCVGVWCTCPAE